MPRLAGSFYKRHAVTVVGTAPAAWGRTVSGAVSLPSRGAFHLSLAVLVRYRSSESVQPWRVVPPASDRVSRARPYSGSRAASPDPSRTGLSPAAAGLPMPFRSNRGFLTRARAWGPGASRPATPARQRPQPWRRRRFGLARFRSPLLARSRLISPPRGT